MAIVSKYYRVDVEMTTGFKYSYTILGRLLEGSVKASKGYWTKSVNTTEITKEEHEATWNVPLIDDKPAKTRKKAVDKSVNNSVDKSVNKSPISFSSIENFFSDEEQPKRKKRR
jgi:hypothetical protein